MHFLLPRIHTSLKATHLGTEPCPQTPRLYLKLQSYDLPSQQNHMVISMRKIIWPQAPLFSPQHLQKGQRRASADEKRRRGAIDNRADTSLLLKPFPARGTWETQRVSEVPPVTHLRRGTLRARSRKTWRGHLTQSSWARATPAPPARATPSADPAPDRRTQCKHSAPAASPPGVGLGEEGAERSRGPTFLRLLSRSGGKREEGEGEGRRGSDQPRGPAPAACARVRGGESCPGARRSRPRSAPAYLPGSLRRFAPPAPS